MSSLRNLFFAWLTLTAAACGPTPEVVAPTPATPTIVAPTRPPADSTSVEVVDENHTAVPGMRFAVRFDDGREVTLTTNGSGWAELPHRLPGKVAFLFGSRELADDDVDPGFQPYAARPGDSMKKLGFVYGFDDEAVWNHHANDTIRKLRKPSILSPGDILFFPRKPLDWRPFQPGQPNRFVVRVPKVALKLALKDPRLKSAAFIVNPFDIVGSTDAEGELEVMVPVYADQVNIDFVGLHIEYNVNLGHLQPVEVTAGLRQRLNHLGYRQPSYNDGVSEADEAAEDARALKAFQKKHGLPDTGLPDDATRAALVKEHGS